MIPVIPVDFLTPCSSAALGDASEGGDVSDDGQKVAAMPPTDIPVNPVSPVEILSSVLFALG